MSPLDDWTPEQLRALADNVARGTDYSVEHRAVFVMVLKRAADMQDEAQAWETYLRKDAPRALDAVRYLSVPKVTVEDRREQNRGFVVKLHHTSSDGAIISGGRMFKRDEAKRIAKWIRDYARQAVENAQATVTTGLVQTCGCFTDEDGATHMCKQHASKKEGALKVLNPRLLTFGELRAMKRCDRVLFKSRKSGERAWRIDEVSTIDAFDTLNMPDSFERNIVFTSGYDFPIRKDDVDGARCSIEHCGHEQRLYAVEGKKRKK